HLLDGCEHLLWRRMLLLREYGGYCGQPRAEPAGHGRPVPGFGEVAVYGRRELPLRLREHVGHLTEWEAELTQPDDPVQPGDVVGVVEPVPSGQPSGRLQQPDLVVMV